MRILVHDFGNYPFCLELSRSLARHGHDVGHAFFPSACTGMGNMAARQDDPANLEIMPVGSGHPYSKTSLIRRHAHETAFGRMLADKIASWKPDIVISANAPLEVQRRALKATRRSGGRFIYWVQDLLSVATGEILSRKLGPLGWPVSAYYERIERASLQGSDSVVCISEDFLPVMKRWGVPAESCQVIENWAPKNDIRPLPKSNPWSQRQGIEDRKVLLYAGRLGYKQKPELLLELALSCRNNPKAMVVVVAGGAGADWLAARKAELNLETLRVLPFQPYPDLPFVLASADILLCVIEAEASRYCVPSKILSYFTAGRAVLAAIPADNLNARHILRLKAGEVADPDDTPSVIAAAHRLLDDDQARGECATRARAYTETAFDIDTITDKFLKVINMAVASKA